MSYLIGEKGPSLLGFSRSVVVIGIPEFISGSSTHVVGVIV